jgi:hypothetical protein
VPNEMDNLAALGALRSVLALRMLRACSER